MKKPKLLTILAAMIPSRSKKRYQVAARAARPQIEEFDDGQPTTKLSSALIVVLILHVVLVCGIYAFNSIKASRRNHSQSLAAANDGAAPTVKAAGDTDAVSASAPLPAANSTSHPASATVAPAPVPPATATTAATAKPGGLRQYVVAGGDTPGKIAYAYRVTPADLLAANGLKDNAVIRAGQTLTIPASKADAKATPDAHKAGTPAKPTDIPPTKTTPGLHIVKKGDTAHSIAKTYGMTADELIRLNKIADPKKLQLGQALKIPPRKS